MREPKKKTKKSRSFQRPGEVLRSEHYDLPVHFLPDGEMVADTKDFHTLTILLAEAMDSLERLTKLHHRFIGDAWNQMWDGRSTEGMSKDTYFADIEHPFPEIQARIEEIASVCAKWKSRWCVSNHRKSWEWHEWTSPPEESTSAGWPRVAIDVYKEGKPQTPENAITIVYDFDNDGWHVDGHPDCKAYLPSIKDLSAVFTRRRRLFEMCLELSPLTDSNLKCIEFDVAALRRMPYDVYLQTDHWKDLAYRVKEAAGFKCSRCGETNNLRAHHITYERRGCELLSDLLCVCDDCHTTIHESGEYHARKHKWYKPDDD